MILNSYPKVNIFLKILSKNDNFHQISSRFMLIVDDVFDILTFTPLSSLDSGLILNGFSFPLEDNLIFKAFNKLLDISKKKIALRIDVVKNIKLGGGLGGGSSNCALSLLAINKIFSLGIKYEILEQIANDLGSDIAFFLKIYSLSSNLEASKSHPLSANVSRRGDKIELFEEEALSLEILSNDIFCDTKSVFNKFHELIMQNKASYYKGVDLKKLDSKDVLKNYDMSFLNDLYFSAKSIYKDLDSIKSSYGKKVFFSGSGSSFFTLLN